MEFASFRKFLRRLQPHFQQNVKFAACRDIPLAQLHTPNSQEIARRYTIMAAMNLFREDTDLLATRSGYEFLARFPSEGFLENFWWTLYAFDHVLSGWNGVVVLLYAVAGLPADVGQFRG